MDQTELMATADAVYRFLLGLTADENLSEELTPQTLYEAVRAAHRYDGTCKLSTWLCQIAKRRYYDHLRRKKHEADLPAEVFDSLAQQQRAPAQQEPEAQLLQQDGMLGIYRAIHTLPEPYREVFLLRATAELRFSEIGAIFGKSENWARVSYYRARQKLSERMSDDEL